MTSREGLALSLSSLLMLGLGCGEERPPVACVLGCPDAGPRCEMIYEPPPTPGDVDGDGIDNDVDDDADGDGVDNEFEHAGGLDCAGPDDDGDGVANWLDRDSDNDGLLDGTERDADSNPYDADSDDDGVSDLIEDAARTDPTNAESGPRAIDFIVVADLDSAAQTRLVRFPNRIENADVFFLVDTTGSMAGERGNLVTGISEIIVPALVDVFDDVAFGAAGFDDYPVDGYGGSGDLPFYLLTPMVGGLSDTQSTNITTDSCHDDVGQLRDGANDVPDIEDAIKGLACHFGNDLPEAFVPALWATATGGQLDWAGGMVPAQMACEADEAGYPCFREEALPVIILIGDASFHNGPMDSNPYGFMAPTYAETIDALNEIGAKVVSIYTGPPDTVGDYTALARDTNTLSPTGEELVYTISGDGTGLDSTVVDGIGTLAEGITQDVTLGISDDDDHPSDAGALVTSWVTTEGYAPDGTPGARTGVSYESKTDTTFASVAPGAEIEFEVTIENTTISPMEEAIVAVVKLNALGDGGASFISRRIFVVVAEDASALVGLAL